MDSARLALCFAHATGLPRYSPSAATVSTKAHTPPRPRSTGLAAEGQFLGRPARPPPRHRHHAGTGRPEPVGREPAPWPAFSTAQPNRVSRRPARAPPPNPHPIRPTRHSRPRSHPMHRKPRRDEPNVGSAWPGGSGAGSNTGSCVAAEAASSSGGRGHGRHAEPCRMRKAPQARAARRADSRRGRARGPNSTAPRHRQAGRAGARPQTQVKPSCAEDE